MSYMAIALISVFGAGLLGFLGILVQYLLKQNTQRHDEHVVAMGAISEQGQRMEQLHTATLELVHETALAARQHADKLHREAMDAITDQGTRMQELHTKAMDAITDQGTRMQELHTKAMDAITALDREHRDHREKMHTETMAGIATLSERTAVLAAKADPPEAA